MGEGSAHSGNTLCQHVPKAAATQSCPAAGQAGVCVVLSSPVLHHIHWGNKKRRKSRSRRREKELIGVTNEICEASPLLNRPGMPSLQRSTGVSQHDRVSPRCVHVRHITMAMQCHSASAEIRTSRTHYCFSHTSFFFTFSHMSACRHVRFFI